VLLLRLTQKRFSSTQFALLSSLFTMPRVLAGPPAGVLADALGWRDFFILTVVTGIPGLVMLARFVPWGVREPEFQVAVPVRARPVSLPDLLRRGGAGAALAALLGLLTLGALGALRDYRAGQAFEPGLHCRELLSPASLTDWLALVGVAVVALFVGLGTAASVAARRGVGAAARIREAGSS
jgi:PAT family beta-lactamase induction signal transducer AmpG